MHFICPLVCHAYKLCLQNAEPIIESLARRAYKYEWAAEKFIKIMYDREQAANLLFEKLTELETDGYYANLFREKVFSEELSALIDTL